MHILKHKDMFLLCWLGSMHKFCWKTLFLGNFYNSIKGLFSKGWVFHRTVIFIPPLEYSVLIWNKSLKSTDKCSFWASDTFLGYHRQAISDHMWSLQVIICYPTQAGDHKRSLQKLQFARKILSFFKKSQK